MTEQDRQEPEIESEGKPPRSKDTGKLIDRRTLLKSGLLAGGALAGGGAALADLISKQDIIPGAAQADKRSIAAGGATEAQAASTRASKHPRGDG
jgi:hypothetical protein